MTIDSDIERFPKPPRGQRHVFAVCRFDGERGGSEPIGAFALTRGYWTESEANRKAAELNDTVSGDTALYFVLPLRVAVPPD